MTGVLTTGEDPETRWKKAHEDRGSDNAAPVIPCPVSHTPVVPSVRTWGPFPHPVALVKGLRLTWA